MRSRSIFVFVSTCLVATATLACGPIARGGGSGGSGSTVAVSSVSTATGNQCDTVTTSVSSVSTGSGFGGSNVTVATAAVGSGGAFPNGCNYTDLGVSDSNLASIAWAHGDIVYVATDDATGSQSGGGRILELDLHNLVVTTLASGQGHPNAIAADDGSAFWTTDEGDVVRVSENGGAPQVLYGGEDHPIAIAYRDGQVYWANAGDGAIKSVPAGGGSLSVIVAGGASIRDLAVDDTYAYFSVVQAGGGAIEKVPLAGGAPVVLAVSPNPRALAADASNVFWLDLDASTSLVSVNRVGLDGSGATVLATGADASSIALTADRVYFAGGHESAPGSIQPSTMKSVSKAGGGVDEQESQYGLLDHAMTPCGDGICVSNAYGEVVERIDCSTP